MKLPWDVVLLLGGGLAIAKGFTETGLEAWIAQKLHFSRGHAGNNALRVIALAYIEVDKAKHAWFLICS